MLPPGCRASEASALKRSTSWMARRSGSSSVAGRSRPLGNPGDSGRQEPCSPLVAVPAGPASVAVGTTTTDCNRAIWARFRAATALVSAFRIRGCRRRPRSHSAASTAAATAAVKEASMADRLNFYVAPCASGGCPQGSLRKVRAVVSAQAMTGEFAAAWLPSVLVPLVGIMGPAVAMALLFNVIEARD
jgi:photosystem I subunit 8